MKLEPNVIIPFGVTKKYLSRYDEVFMGKEEEISDFDLEISYPPFDYCGEIYWNECSYNRLIDTNLTWTYDFYSCGDW